MKTTGWRKVAMSIWGWPNDPQIYGRIEIDARPVLEAVEAIRAKTGVRVTVTHFVTKGLGLGLKENPSLNTRISRGRFRQRESADVFVIVSTGAGKDLSGVKVKEADAKSVAEIARETSESAGAARRGESIDMERSKKVFSLLPLFLLRRVLRVGAFLTTNLNLDLTRFAMPRQPFGSAMVSSVGMFGITEGFAPLSSLYRVPMIVLVGEVVERPWAENGKVVVRPVLPLTATFDHRWMDGHGIAGLSETFQKYLSDPLAYEP